MSEQAFQAARMMQSAADDVRRSANLFDERSVELRNMFEQGCGGVIFEVVELLREWKESQDSVIPESQDSDYNSEILRAEMAVIALRNLSGFIAPHLPRETLEIAHESISDITKMVRDLATK